MSRCPSDWGTGFFFALKEEMGMARKLASIQMVHGVEPIEGADRIELAKVLGWQCVVPKG